MAVANEADHLAVVVSKIPAGVSYGTAAVTVVLSGLTINEWLGVVGIFCALGTFAVNVWFHHRADRRSERLANAQMRGIKH